MKVFVTTALAAASIALLAAPVAAQEEEQARTTWTVTAIDVNDGAGGRWEEIVMETLMPAHDDAGIDRPQLHWVVANNDWDYVMIRTMPRGMAAFDTHANPERMALWQAIIARAGSEEAAEALMDELDSLEAESTTLYTHSHP